MTKKNNLTLSSHSIVFIIVLFTAFLTWVVPSGSFERMYDVSLGRDIVIPGSFSWIEQTPVGLWKLCLCIFEGFVDSGDIIFFLLFAYGFISFVIDSGVIINLVHKLLKRLKNREYLMIPIFFPIFALGGALIGITEEMFGLVPIFITLALLLGYDRMTGGAIVLLGTSVGVGASILNPFTIGVASSIAQVPIVTTELLMFRLFAFVIFVTVSVLYLLRYAGRVKKQGIAENKIDRQTEGLSNLDGRLTVRQKAILTCLLLVLGIMVFGIVYLDFYIPEIAALFFVGMIAAGLLDGKNIDAVFSDFILSAQTMVSTIILVGLARTMQVVIMEGNIIDTIVFGLSNIIQSFPPQLSAIIMLFVQSIISFFIPSGSGQAIVMMPIMVQIADLSNVSRNVAIIAFQYGCGFSCIFWPAGCSILCGVMKVSLQQWYKFFVKLYLLLLAIQVGLVSLAVFLGI